MSHGCQRSPIPKNHWLTNLWKDPKLKNNDRLIIKKSRKNKHFNTQPAAAKKSRSTLPAGEYRMRNLLFCNKIELWLPLRLDAIAIPLIFLTIIQTPRSAVYGLFLEVAPRNLKDQLRTAFWPKIISRKCFLAQCSRNKAWLQRKGQEAFIR